MINQTYLYREIYEQPDVIHRFLEKERPSIKELSKAIHKQEISHVVIAARGTSDNAGRYAQYVLGAKNSLTVALATPSLFSIYKRPPKFGNALVIGISQSGKSPDIVSVLTEARQQGVLTAVITNNPHAELALLGDFVIDLHAGEEKSVAATKTYTAELAAIATLSSELAGSTKMANDLRMIPEALEKILHINTTIGQIAPRYRYMERSVVIGRGFNYATAYELALKLKELTYTIAEPYSSADFLHGPLAMIEPGFPVIVIAPSGEMQAEMFTFIKTLNQRRAEVIAISDVEEILNPARIQFRLQQHVSEWLSPITSIVPGQLFAMHLADSRDLDVDAPRGLTKVTKTR